jgi:sugar/nucleoside kinase (ribokinase family)
MSETRLVCLDTVMIDVVLRIASLPHRGSDQLVSQQLLSAGGGFNVMSAAARQGMNVLYAGQLGTGPFADMAQRSLAKESIATPIPSTDQLDIGLCFVLVDDEGERTFITSPGAEGTLTTSELRDINLQSSDVIYFSGYDFVYETLCEHVMGWLRDFPSDVIVAFDPGPRVLDIDARVLDEVLERTDWLLCNETEALALTKPSSVSEAARALVRKVSAGVVVRSGEDGCVVARTGYETVHVPGVPTDVVDTNGAGDVHNGVFLVELSRGTDVIDALRRANVAASIAIGQVGPATCPTRDVIDAHL